MRNVISTTAVLLAAAFIGSHLAAQGPRPNWPGTSRTDLQRHDLSTVGRETLQARIDFAPGAFATRHKHPGEEIFMFSKGPSNIRSTGARRSS